LSRPVFHILFADRVACHAPLLVRPFAQRVEISPGRKLLPAVHRYGLTIEPLATVGQQKCGKILKFLKSPGASHRVEFRRSSAGFFAWRETFAHALGRNFAWSDRIEP